MKPITLKLSGLQSYREAQEVDFTELCETGLFGIFGPTGSGKSTVLDAITLAMYGKVERAYGGTQGIMNHSEDTLYVAFTFQLESAAGARRFRVERRFKRTGEVSVSNTLSRFVEVKPEGDEVVADKLADVTRAVEDVIGLKMDDFTRAVVLPQGKFAEFLSLKGSDRRQMLQRLFHLEQYGDKLVQKLNKRTRETESALRTVEAEQQGLGPASADDVAAARGRLDEAGLNALERRRALDGAVEEHGRLSRVRERAHERRSAASALDELRGRGEAVRELEARALRAQAASALLPALERFRGAAKRSEELAGQAARLRGALGEAQSAASRAAAAESEAREALSGEEPRLLRRSAELEQALRLERELEGLRADSAELERDRGEAAARLERAREGAQQLRRKLEQAGRLQSELQEQLAACEVRSADRSALEEAGRLADSAAALEEQLPGVRRDLEEAERQEREASAELSAAREREVSCRAALEQAAVRAEAGAASLRRLDAGLSALLEAAAAEERRLERADLDSAKRRMAAELAHALADGEPCPVCGAQHHPQPADEDPSAASAAADPEPLRDLQLGARELRLNAARLRQGGETLAARLREELAHSRAAEAPADISASASTRPAPGAAPAPGSSFPFAAESANAAAGAIDRSGEPPAALFAPDAGAAAGESAPAAEASASPAACAAEYARLRSAAELAEREASALEAEAREAERAWSAAVRGAEAPRARLEGAARQKARAGERLAELERRLEEASARWNDSFADLRRDELERRREEIRRRDGQAEELKLRLEKSGPVIRSMEDSLKSHEEQSAEAERLLVQLTVQAEGKAELAAEKESRLREASNGANVAELLRDTAGRLNRLREAAERTRRDMESSREAWQRQASASAAADQAASSAAEHAEAAESGWREALDRSPFESDDDAENARMDEEDVREARELVQAHRERENELNARLRELEKLLDGADVSEAQWEECVRRLEECRRLDEEALAARARAQRDLEDVSGRHERWTALESRRSEKAAEAERLSKLQSCFRGNAFVEYVAEEQLIQISRAASNRLRFLTKQRYSLEVDSGGGFVVRDDANGGVRRPVSTLSGGETFLTSLALALALSAQIQLRGEYPLQFFFLDEGFGTLDPELLDTVVTSLEHLHSDRLSVGIISHVQELRERLPRRLIVQPADHAGAGSKVVLEKM
ncbi:SMC family ATPase [Saccharibacillus sp. CPCC 101409]|uniref:AAA family ATPase n=1 Tax=Saccharibacillus sp. CPCC 101409 TaxID=3058041 RepID=UPI002672EEFB|nr:SMC family ATPase [Saccharibacillus sp. CPCC 101409]MDO3409163.1 SMC family ATPase [Saccharibacillus sp. CPCC 101409]